MAEARIREIKKVPIKLCRRCAWDCIVIFKKFNINLDLRVLLHATLFGRDGCTTFLEEGINGEKVKKTVGVRQTTVRGLYTRNR